MKTTHTACLVLAFAFLAVAACEEPGPSIITPGDNDGDNDCPPPCSPDANVPAPWDTLTWELTEIDVGNPTLPAGIQNRMIRKPNGDIYVAYFKQRESDPDCTISVFGGPDSAPSPKYDLRVATLPNGGSSWSIDEVTIPGDPGHATSRFGIDATLDGSGNLVVVLAAGDSSMAQCGSTDVVRCTRIAQGNWSCVAVAGSSDACCGDVMSGACQASLTCELDWCRDPNCTNANPGDVGAWSTIAKNADDDLGIAFTDIHNYWDEDGMSHRGLEFTEEGSAGVSGIRPWSGQGKYAALTYDGNIPVVAFTGYAGGGLGVLRRPTTNGDGNDWVAPNAESRLDVWDGFVIGERIRLEWAPDNTLGLLFHAAKDKSETTINDLVYCTSTNGGETWGFPCQKLVSGHVGAFPGLAYDADSVPYVVYRFCGSAECPQSQDGVRMAWFDDSTAYGKWWRFDVHNETSSRSGAYNQIVVDPATKEPTIAFQHVTRGSLVIARGSFGP